MTRSLLSSLALVLSLALSANAATVQFAARQDVQTSFQHLTGIAVADFNGDGFPDLAVTDDYANQVTVYLNNGHGGFSKPTVTTLTTTGYGGLGDLVAGDVNEDGKQDLIVAPIAGLQYDIVLLGNGDGTFTQGQVLKATYGFQNAQLVDMNGDKHLDLVSGGNPSLSIELGDGKGNFTDSSIPSSQTPIFFNTGLTTGDFNGDGHPDLLTGAYNTPYLQLFNGKGDGTFQVPAKLVPSFLSTSGPSLAAADFNGDGKLDFLLGEADVAVVVFGNGDGTFNLGASQTRSPLLPYVGGVTNPVAPQLAVADMDASGTPDIVAADDNSALLSVFLNDGTGNFAQPKPDFTAAIDAGTGQIRTADLNGDGLPDVIITNYKTQKISIFLSVIPTTTPAVSIASSAPQTTVGSNITLTVQVKPSASHVPTGTVTLTGNTTSYGQQTLDANGQATFTLQNLAAGQYSFTAAYSGDKYNNAASNTTAFSQSITDFQVALAASSQSVAVGASATYPVTLTPVAGLSGTVTLTCSGLPSAYQCASTTAALTGQATSASLIVSPVAKAELHEPGAAHRTPVSFAGLGLAALCLCWRKRRHIGVLAAVVGFLAGSRLLGCSSSPAAPPPYTGTSSFTITATYTQGPVTLSHQTTATLTVHQ